MKQQGLLFKPESKWKEVCNQGGLFFVSHSGGKDSQAMLAYLIEDLHIPLHQIILVHAHLGTIEWNGVIEHIEQFNYGLQLNIALPVKRDGSVKTFLSMVRERGMWPSPKNRQCTSDLKRGPIYKVIRKVMKERSVSIGVNCTGLRAEESSKRRKMADWGENKELSKAGRTVYEWLPIHDWTTCEVFDRIYSADQHPHPCYGAQGELNSRMSCVFCIMGSVNDHINGAIQRPELYEEVVGMEHEMGHTMFAGQTLEERNNLTVEDAYNLNRQLILKTA